MRNLRIAMLSNAVAPDKLGGLERYVSDLAAHLATAGHDVTVIAKQADPGAERDEMRSDGVRVLRYVPPAKRDPLFFAKYVPSVLRQIRAIVHQLPADTIVHSHFALLSSAASRRPYLQTLHAPVYKELLSERQDSYALPAPLRWPAVRALRGVEARALRRASRVICLSEFMADEARTLLRGRHDRVDLVPGGLDGDWFSPGDEARPDWAADAEPLVFTARRLVPRTGVAELVTAMRRIVDALPAARLAVAGDGLQRDTIQARIAELGLESRVVLLGRIPDDELRRWYRSADLTVTPTQFLEGFGLATAESMSCGTPAVVTPVGANAEVAGRLAPQLVARSAAPADIAAAVLDAVRDRERLAGWRHAARASVQPELRWANVVRRHEALYSDATDATGSRTRPAVR